MKIRKCINHEIELYTLNEKCPKCGELTKEAHYKYVKIKNNSEKEN